MYRIAGDNSIRDRLLYRLTWEAMRLSVANQWPKKGKPYVRRLCELLLAEERWKIKQRNCVVRAAVMGVSERTWYRKLHKPYGQITFEFESWIGTAWRHVARRLSGR